MALFRRQETTDGRGSVLVAELTTAQAVMVLCAALVLLGAAFVSGRLVAQVDRPIGPVAAPPTQSADNSGEPNESAPPTAPASDTKVAQVQLGPTQTYTIPAMDAAATIPAPPSSPASVPTTSTAAATAVSPAVAPTPPASSTTTPPAAAPSAAPPALVPVQEPAVAPATATPQPAQVIPVPSVSPPAPPPQTSALLASTKPRLTDLPPLPSNHEPKDPTPLPVEKIATPVPASAQTVGTAPVPATSSAPAEPPLTEPATATEALAPVAKTAEPAVSVALPSPETLAAAAPPVDPKPAPPAQQPAAATTATGTFAVQLGSFTGPQRQTKAQTLQKRIKKDYGLNAQVVDSDKENLSRVVIGGYADKNSASAACGELRKKSGMASAFVRPM